MKKYQHCVFSKRISDDPPNTAFIACYYPVEIRDGKRVVCGEGIGLPYEDESQSMSYADEFRIHGPTEEMAEGIVPPDGWEIAAQFPLPDGFVPESQEVAEELQKRARDYLRSRGIGRD